MRKFATRFRSVTMAILLGLTMGRGTQAQTPAPLPPSKDAVTPGDAKSTPSDSKPTEAAGKTEEGPIARFAWLEGCWRGEVNRREYREHWLPLRGGLMIGVSHTTSEGKTQGYEYLRLEPRADGVYYIVNITTGPT